MSITIRMIGCAVALAATANLGPAQAQQSQASTWCYASEATAFRSTKKSAAAPP